MTAICIAGDHFERQASRPARDWWTREAAPRVYESVHESVHESQMSVGILMRAQAALGILILITAAMVAAVLYPPSLVSTTLATSPPPAVAASTVPLTRPGAVLRLVRENGVWLAKVRRPHARQQLPEAQPASAPRRMGTRMAMDHGFELGISGWCW